MKKLALKSLIFVSATLAALAFVNPGLVRAEDEFPDLGEDGYYYINEDVRVTGIYGNNKGTYYFSEGKKQRGWIVVDGNSYYFDEKYKMVTGWNEINGVPYFFHLSTQPNSDTHIKGAIQTGWIIRDGKAFYYDPITRQPVVGWQTIDGEEYYFYEETTEKTEKFALKTGWVTKDDLKFYYSPKTHQKVTGWQNINGIDFYFYESTKEGSSTHIYGNMARDTKIKGKKLNKDGVTDKVKYKMYKKASSLSSNTQYLILVDTTNCKVGIFEGEADNWNMIKYWKCSPGASSSPTVTGTFKIQGRRTFFISGNSWCHWATGFYGNYMFHSTLYNSNGTHQDSRLGMNLSHGCVRLAIKNAKWIYDNIPRGTKVVVYRK